MSESRSAKNGMTSAMIKARIHVAARMPAHADQPMTVLLPLWRVPSKMRKKMKRAETEA